MDLSQIQQKQSLSCDKPKQLVSKRNGISLKDNRQHSTIQKKANNTGLPNQLKSGIENLSGHSMDDVKVHYNSSKPAQLNAHAYAQGTDIHIASGQEKHLPHEAWHVVQQKQGRVRPTMQLKAKVNINDDKSLEKEADVMGAKALQMKALQNSTPAQLTKNKKKDNWRTGKIDSELKKAKTVMPTTAVDADTGHHKLAKSKLKKLYPHLSATDKKALSIDGVKGLMSLPSNLTFGPNSSERSDDPGSDFDANYNSSGVMTPRSSRLRNADQELDKGKLSKVNGTNAAVGGGLALGGVLGGLGYLGAGIVGLASAPLLAAGAAAAVGVGVGSYLGYKWGNKKKKESDTSKKVILSEIGKAQALHGAKGLDPDLSMWQHHGGKFHKRKQKKK